VGVGYGNGTAGRTSVLCGSCPNQLVHAVLVLLACASEEQWPTSADYPWDGVVSP
jgi:hypothetical protein